MFDDLKITEPVFLRNLVVFPIKRTAGEPENGRPNLFTIDEIIASENGGFRELEIPEVNKIVFENNGDNPALMLDGEEITGSLQNRIIAVSNLVEARSAKNIPVICVEEKRWEEIGGFRTGHCSYPKIRSILAKRANKKIDTQDTVWNEIERKLTITKTFSQTSSMHDIYDNLEDEITRYIEGFKSLNHDTVGFIGVAGNQILGCDIFPSPDIYHKFETKLVRSYALEALEYQRLKGTEPKVDEFLDSIMKKITGGAIKARSKNISIKGKGFIGQVLRDQDSILHLSAFPCS